MKWSSIGTKIVALSAAILLGALTVAGAGAQYPPPSGSLSLSASTTTPTTGSVVSVSARAVDQTGAVLGNVACAFRVVSQPGSDAVVDAGPKITDATGIATTSLTTGSTPGTIIVGADCGGLSSQITVQVDAAAPIGTDRLPSTGMGPVEEASWSVTILGTLLVGGMLSLAAGSALFVATKRVRGF
jgi:hypothetical protein